MGQDFQTTSKSDPCPICDDITGKCRLLPSGLTLCMSATSSVNVPGWRFTKLNKTKLWGIWAPDEERKGSPDDWKREQQIRQEARDRRAAFQLKNSLKPAQKNRYYRQLLASLKLHPDDRADLISRGFTDEEIAVVGFKSVEQWQKLDIELPVNLPGVAPSGQSLLISGAGYLCPIPDHKGRIVGMQLRLREVKGKGGRYRWLSSRTKKRPNGAGPAVRDGENPLPVIGADQFSGTIFLAEGTGAKPWLTYQRFQQPVVGAAGGLWGSSLETLRVSLKAIAQQPPSQTEIVFIPDAGDAANHKVRGRNQTTFKALADLGYQVKVMWWGQVLKADPDIDERPAGSPYKLISVDEFWEICDRERISAVAREDQAKINALTYKPNLLVAQKRLPDLRLPKPGSFLFISSPMGSGKTYQTDRFIKEFKQLRDEGLIRFVGCRNSLLRQTMNNLQVANPALNIDLIHDLAGAGENTASMINTYDVVGLCIDSLLRIDVNSLKGGLIFLDEVDSTLRHLLIGNTCDRNREEIMMHFQAIIQRVLSTGGYVVAAEANITDLTIDTLRGLAPKAPMTLIVNEGTSDPWDVTVLTEASAVTRQAIEGYKSGQKQIIATDSQKYAEQLEGVIAELHPDATVLRVDRKTSEREDIRAFITSPNEIIAARQPDFLIYTPTLESGTDITIDYFDQQLFCFVNLETRTQSQMLGRYRLPVPRIGYVKESAFSDEAGSSLRPEVLAKDARTNTKNAHNITDLALALVQQQPEGSEVNWGELVNEIINPLPGTPAHHWVEYWAGYKARENGARAEMRANLIRALRQQGHRVKILETAHDPHITELKKAVKDRIQLREADELASEDAEGITLDIAYKILSSNNATEKSRRKARKAILQDKLPGVELGVTFLLEAVVKDQGKLLKQTTQLWDVQNLDSVKAIEQKNWLRRIDIRPFIYHPAIKHRALRAEVLSRLGILEFIEAEEPLDLLEGSKDPRLRTFLDQCLWIRHDIRRALGINITAKTTAIQALGRLLKKVGYELKNRKVGPRGQQVRLWNIHHRAPEVQATILTALSLKHAEIAPVVSTTFYINNKQAGLDTNGSNWSVGLKARDKISGVVGTITFLEPDMAVFQLEDGTERPWLLEQLEVMEATAV